MNRKQLHRVRTGEEFICESEFTYALTPQAYQARKNFLAKYGEFLHISDFATVCGMVKRVTVPAVVGIRRTKTSSRQQKRQASDGMRPRVVMMDAITGTVYRVRDGICLTSDNRRMTSSVLDPATALEMLRNAKSLDVGD